MTMKYLKYQCVCFLEKDTITYLGVPVALAVVIPRAWISWVTLAKPMGAVPSLRSWVSSRQPSMLN